MPLLLFRRWSINQDHIVTNSMNIQNADNGTVTQIVAKNASKKFESGFFNMVVVVTAGNYNTSDVELWGSDILIIYPAPR